MIVVSMKSKRFAGKSIWLHESHFTFKWIELSTGMQIDNFRRPLKSYYIYVKSKERERERER